MISLKYCSEVWTCWTLCLNTCLLTQSIHNGTVLNYRFATKEQQFLVTNCKESKVLSRALRPMGRRWSPFPWPSTRHQFLHCKTTDTGPVYRAVCLFTSKPWSWYQIILPGDRGMCGNNLPKVVTRQCPSAESNLRPWVTSGLQVRHVTIRLPSHTN